MQVEVDSLVTELGKAREDTNKVKILRDLANNAGYTDLNVALDYALQGFELSKKIKYDYGIGTMAYLAGFTYTDLNSYAKADSFLTIAEQKFLETGDKRQLAKCANARGSMSYKQGDYWAAADNFLKSAEGFDALKDSSLSLLVYQNLISVLGQIKNYDKAIITGKTILKIAEARKDTLQIGYTLQSLCTNLIYLNKFDEAFPYLQSLLFIAGSTIDHNLAAEAYSTAGTYYFKKENYHQAVSYYEASIEKALTLDDKYQLANQYNSLGQSFLSLNNLTRAKEYFDKAAILAKDYDNKRAAYAVALSLGDYFSKAGDYKSGYQNLLIHLVLMDSMLDAETRNYTSYIETKYENNKKENEILRLQQAEQKKDFALRKRNIYLGIAGGLLLIAIIILSLLRKNFRNKQKLAKQQSVLQEERILSMQKQQQVISLQSMIKGQETERTR